MNNRGYIFGLIIVMYILFIFLYGMGVLATNDFMSETNSLKVNPSQSNITAIGNKTLNSSSGEIGSISSLKCQGDMAACSMNLITLMFSLDQAVTPFYWINYFTWLFTLLFFISIVKELILPLLEAIIPL